MADNVGGLATDERFFGFGSPPPGESLRNNSAFKKADRGVEGIKDDTSLPSLARIFINGRRRKLFA